jgi:IS30 family transposase
VAPPPGPSRYLREDDRIHIADRLGEKASVRAIAAELCRSPSTISREIRRNRHPVNGQYRPHAAQARADARRPRPKTGKIAANPELRQAVQCRLEMEWSPEQISKTLLAQFPAQPEMQVSHETIYQALYVQGRGELRRELTRALRTGRARRIPHRRPDQRQPRFTTPMVMISERPAEAGDRAVPGHWEGDLERHEAPCNRAGVEGLRRWAVAAA